jgi:hypothetical protein
MERKEIAALLVGCEPDQFMAYKDYGDHVAVIAPDGKKFVYTNDQLAAAEPPAKSGTGKPAPKPRRKPSTKKTAAKKAPASKAKG